MSGLGALEGLRRLVVVDDGDVSATGVKLPSGTFVVEWRREFFDEDDRTEAAVKSQYETIDDVRQATGGEILFVDSPGVDTLDAIGAIAKTMNTLLTPEQS